MAHLSNGLRSARHLPCRAEFLRQAMMAASLVARSFVAVFSTPAAGQDKRADAKSDQKAASTPDEKKATFATGVLVSELGKSAIYVLQAKNNDYWFGSNDRGAYRYDGMSFEWLTDKILTEAPVRSIFEDKKGNFWFSYSGEVSLDGIRVVNDIGKLQELAKGTILQGMSIIEDDSGKLCTAALKSGAFKYDGEQKVGYPIKEGKGAVEVFAIEDRVCLYLWNRSPRSW